MGVSGLLAFLGCPRNACPSCATPAATPAATYWLPNAPSLIVHDLYFAYGSSLDLDGWRTRREQSSQPPPAVRPVATGFLPDRHLVYTRRFSGRGGGVLDIVPSPGCVVPGVIFAAQDQATWRALASQEGAPAAYQRLSLHALTAAGQVLAVQTLVGPRPRLDCHQPPTAAYREKVTRGLRQWGIDPQWHQQAASAGGPSALPFVFTYGTLRPGEPNAHLLGPAAAVAARVPGRLHSLGAYPVLTPAQSQDQWVAGELVTVPDLPECQQLTAPALGWQGEQPRWHWCACDRTGRTSRPHPRHRGRFHRVVEHERSGSAVWPRHRYPSRQAHHRVAGRREAGVCQCSRAVPACRQ